MPETAIRRTLLLPYSDRSAVPLIAVYGIVNGCGKTYVGHRLATLLTERGFVYPWTNTSDHLFEAAQMLLTAPAVVADRPDKNRMRSGLVSPLSAALNTCIGDGINSFAAETRLLQEYLDKKLDGIVLTGARTPGDLTYVRSRRVNGQSGKLVFVETDEASVRTWFEKDHPNLIFDPNTLTTPWDRQLAPDQYAPDIIIRNYAGQTEQFEADLQTAVQSIITAFHA